MTTQYVTIYCAGSRKHPHPQKLSLVARFQPVGSDVWEEMEVTSDEYERAMDTAGEDPTTASFDALSDHPGYPRQVATQWITEGGVPRPESIAGGADGLAFWNRQPTYGKYALRCSLCGLDATVKDGRLFPILTEVASNGPEFGESRLALSEVVASL